MSKSVSKSELEKRCHSYAIDTIEEYDLEVDIINLRCKVSGRLTKTVCKNKIKKDEYFMKISWNYYKDCGWAKLKDHVRFSVGVFHEYNSDDSWGEIQEMLSIDHIDGSPIKKKKGNVRYMVECRNCNMQYPRKRKSKVVKNPDMYVCADCGEQELYQKW